MNDTNFRPTYVVEQQTILTAGEATKLALLIREKMQWDVTATHGHEPDMIAVTVDGRRQPIDMSRVVGWTGEALDVFADQLMKDRGPGVFISICMVECNGPLEFDMKAAIRKASEPFVRAHLMKHLSK